MPSKVFISSLTLRIFDVPSSLAFAVLNGYMPRIRAKCDLFVAQLYKAQRPLDVSAWSMYLAFDIMGEAGFSKDFGGVSKGVEHAAIKGVHDSMSLIGIVSHVPWLFNIGTRIPGALAGYAPFIRWCADEIENKKKVMPALQRMLERANLLTTRAILGLETRPTAR